MPSAMPWSFGPFRLDPDRACLWHEGQAIPLSPTLFAVLHYLVTHPDRLVTKAELLDAVWSHTAVTDAVLRVAIGTLRKVLGDTAQAPRYIVPALVAQLVIVVKETTFGYVVTYGELMQNARVLIANYHSLVPVYLAVAALYCLVNYAISRASRRLSPRASAVE